MNLPHNPISLDAIRGDITHDMVAVDTLIRKRLSSEVILINQISHYIIESGGKRLRPALVLLAGNHFAAGKDNMLEIDCTCLTLESVLEYEFRSIIY